MSKSKKNVVDPGQIIDLYGADTARLFVLSDSPPERDIEWTEAGVEGCWRYVNRLWRCVMEPKSPMATPEEGAPASLGEKALAVRQMTHKTIAEFTQDLEGFHFNRAVARARELTNALDELDGSGQGDGYALREGLEMLVRLLNPMLPHITEELWQQLGHRVPLVKSQWPKADPALLVETSVTIAVQVNGKLRATLQVAKDADKAATEAMALEQEGVKRALEGLSIKKVIVVPNKIVNIVAA